MDYHKIPTMLVFLAVSFVFFEIYSLYVARKMLTKWCHNHGYRIIEAKLDWGENWREQGVFGRYKALDILLES